MKLRSDSNLAKLTEDQRAELFDWLSEQSYADVIARAERPAPDGFGIKFSRTTLQRFYEDFERVRRADRLADLAVTAPDPQGLPSEILQLWTATRIQVAHATLDLALHAGRSTGGVPVNFDRVTRALHQFEVADLGRKHFALDQQRLQFDQDHKTQQLDLKNRQFAFDQEKFKIQRLLEEFNIARELLKSAPEYLDILQRTDIDDENKVWLARERCYGPSPLAPYPPQPSIVENRGDTIQTTPRPLPATPDSVTQYNTLQHTSAQSTPEICVPGRASACPARASERAVPSATTAAPQPVPSAPKPVPSAPKPAAPQSVNLKSDNLESSACLPHSSTLLHTSAEPTPENPTPGRAAISERAVPTPNVDSRGDTTPIPPASPCAPAAPHPENPKPNNLEPAVPNSESASQNPHSAIVNPQLITPPPSLTQYNTLQHTSAESTPEICAPGAPFNERAVPTPIVDNRGDTIQISTPTNIPTPDAVTFTILKACPDSESAFPSHPAVKSAAQSSQSVSAVASAELDEISNLKSAIQPAPVRLDTCHFSLERMSLMGLTNVAALETQILTPE